MTHEQRNMVATLITILGVMGTVVGSAWLAGRKTESIAKDVAITKRDLCRTEQVALDAAKRATKNENGISVVQTMLRANFDEVLRRLERIEASSDAERQRARNNEG